MKTESAKIKEPRCPRSSCCLFSFPLAPPRSFPLLLAPPRTSSLPLAPLCASSLLLALPRTSSLLLPTPPPPPSFSASCSSSLDPLGGHRVTHLVCLGPPGSTLGPSGAHFGHSPPPLGPYFGLFLRFGAHFWTLWGPCWPMVAIGCQFWSFWGRFGSHFGGTFGVIFGLFFRHRFRRPLGTYLASFSDRFGTESDLKNMEKR